MLGKANHALEWDRGDDCGDIHQAEKRIEMLRQGLLSQRAKSFRLDTVN